MGTTEIKENKDVVENAEVVEDTEVVEDVQEIKPYTLRNPKATDIAAFLKLFSKLGVKDFKDSQLVRSGTFESRGELEATIKDSMSIIENFKP